jgi:acetoacetate decarboxylase
VKYDGLPRAQVIAASHIPTDLPLTRLEPVFDYLKESTK